MAKISNTLKQIKESFDTSYPFFGVSSFSFDSGKFNEFICLFDDVSDTRMPNKCKYSTKTIVVLVFLAILDEMDTWQEIAEFARERRDFLSEFIDLSSGTPSHDTIMRVFSLINSDTLQTVLVDFLKSTISNLSSHLIDDTGYTQLAIDGKEARASGRNYGQDNKVKNMATMNFYDVGTNICISSVTIDDKSNEIPVAQSVLNQLNIKNFIISSDAMNTQKKTVETIINGKAHYVLGLKGNHSDLYNEAIQTFNNTVNFSEKNYYKMELDKCHSQVEHREFYRLDASKLVFSDSWAKLKSVVVYKKTVFSIKDDTERVEYRYYISDLIDLQTISLAIRRHWAIENELHWHLDTSYNEDANTTMNRKALTNLSTIYKSSLTLMKLIQPLFGNKSIRVTKKKFRMYYEDNIFKLFSLLDSDVIQSLIK
jgi:predicted transposase YbfD/YdcC